MTYKEDKRKNRREITKALSMFSQIGITMAVTLFISVMAGKYLDMLAGTSPLFLLVFSFLGMLAAFRNLYIITKKFWGK